MNLIQPMLVLIRVFQCRKELIWKSIDDIRICGRLLGNGLYTNVTRILMEIMALRVFLSSILERKVLPLIPVFI